MFGEHRLCYELSSGPGYFKDWTETYAKGSLPAKLAGVVSLGVEGFDVLTRNVLGGRYEKPDQNPIGHITRDMRQAVDHISKGELFPAVGAIISAPGSLVMDGVDGITGARRN